MKFTVIGHFCIDSIHYPGKKDQEGYGGIFYSVVALANIARAEDTVYPVFGVGTKEFADVKERFSAYPNVDTSGIFAFDGETNKVHLFYKEGGTRIECSASIAPPNRAYACHATHGWRPTCALRAAITADLMSVNAGLATPSTRVAKRES